MSLSEYLKFAELKGANENLRLEVIILRNTSPVLVIYRSLPRDTVLRNIESFMASTHVFFSMAQQFLVGYGLLVVEA
jgi:hypothetical protein